MNLRGFIAVLLVAVVCAGSLSACGKKGPLTPPPDSEYPKQYPRR